jgi:hypothetical protein
MTSNGTVVASVPASKAIDAVGNPNAASTSTDRSVIYDLTASTATVTAANVTATASTYAFSIDWADLSGVDYTTVIGQSNIAINKQGGGSNGNCLCTAWVLYPDLTNIRATYEVTLEHAWTDDDNGTWNIIHVDETETQVADSCVPVHKVALGAVLRTITVNIAAGKKSRMPMTLIALRAAGVLEP